MEETKMRKEQEETQLLSELLLNFEKELKDLPLQNQKKSVEELEEIIKNEWVLKNPKPETK